MVADVGIAVPGDLFALAAVISAAVDVVLVAGDVVAASVVIVAAMLSSILW